MEVLLLKDVSGVGLAGQVVKVSEGHARNLLFPRKLAKVASAQEVTQFRAALERQVTDKSVAGSRVAHLAEQLENLKITLKEKANEQGKLYGAVGAEEIVALLGQQGINLQNKQIFFEKAIRSTGEYKVGVKLTAKLQPQFTLKVVAA